ncbi:2-oxo acid dehydrogenase subunit E2 [Methylobacter svalbardensis]|uniref:2-oxo acid dehydrogenase subunit E2 n=1 Tax=Methylobacter svalbardensis TaxID=3080016 RepID=UPI0030ECCFB4
MAALIEIKVPDVGNVADIDVVDVLVKPGDTVKLEQTLAVLETDKASMDLPASAAGIVQELFIKPGDKVSEGTLVVTLLPSTETVTPSVVEEEVGIAQPVQQAVAVAPVEAVVVKPESLAGIDVARAAHATPAVRLFARELGVDIQKITSGSGRKGRLLKEDVRNFVKKVMTEGAAQGGSGIPAMPSIDFSQFGETEEQQLSKIKRLTGKNLNRVWLNLPMVTYHDEADITEMEAFRVALNAEKSKEGIKITGLLFIIKALVVAMEQFPQFNASLSADGEKLIFKKYLNIGIAVDTPNGLVVPVLRDVNRKGINELSVELAEKSNKARLGKLMPADMQGGCITISSLGGIGGTAFTPIVNAPEVAILGVTRAKMQPVWNGKEFLPRLMLPLDLTYDHRVIDGAEGARFMAAVKQYLGDIRRLLL